MIESKKAHSNIENQEPVVRFVLLKLHRDSSFHLCIHKHM